MNHLFCPNALIVEKNLLNSFLRIYIKREKTKMSIDGANLGVDAEKSCKAVLGGEQPKEEDMRNPEQMREYLMSAPESYEEGQKSYGEAARWLARQYLILLDVGCKDSGMELYKKVKEKFGNRDMDFTGFMVGWAENAARYVKELPEKNNPAIIKI